MDVLLIQAIKEARTIIRNYREGEDGALLRSSGSVLLAALLGTVFGFTANAILARSMGVSSFGLFSFLLTVTMVVQAAVGVGLPTTVVRFLPGYINSGDYPRARGLLVWISTTQFAVVGVTVLVGIICTTVISPEMLAIPGADLAEVRPALICALLVLPAFCVASVKGQIVRSLGNAGGSAWSERVLRTSAIVAIALIWNSQSTKGLSAAGALVVHGIAVSIAALVLASMQHRLAPIELRRVKGVYEQKVWSGMALSTAVTDLLAILATSTDRILVGSFLGTADAAIYAASGRIAELAAFGMLAINAVIGPILAKKAHSRDVAGLQSTLTFAARANFLYATLVFAFVGVFGSIILALFGDAFVSGYQVLFILALGRVVVSAFGSVGLLLAMTGYQVVNVIVTSGVILLNIGLTSFLMPTLGALGAAVASSVVLSVWSLTLNLFARKYVGVDSSILGRMWSRS